MITLYGMGSPNVVKVLIALEELGLAYDFRYVEVLRGDQFEEAFGELTPNRKVPVLVDGEGPARGDGFPFRIWESGAILLYLAEKTGRLLPADPAGRYAAWQWLMFQMASVGPMSGQHAHFTWYAKHENQHYANARYTTEVKRIYDVLETRLRESAYLAGDEFTIADIATWPWLRGSYPKSIDISDRPALHRWVEEIRARPAAQRALEVIASLDTTDTMRIIKEGGPQLDRYLGRGAFSRPEPA